MKVARVPHRWDLSPRRAVAVQRHLAGRVRRTPPGEPLRLVAGLDVAFTADGESCVAGVVIWDRTAAEVVEHRVAIRPLRFPYVPGLLSFREAPALLAALRKLRQAPDALMCDGHGLAHPRRFGIACHLGVLTDLPSVGCAKSVLVGTFREPGGVRGRRTALRDGRERIGTVLRTQQDVNPVYVSIGHLIDLGTAERLVLACAVRYRLPEPTRLADRLVAAAKRRPATAGRRG